MCASCGAHDVRHFVKKDGYDVFQCRACGHGFVHPMPTSTKEVYEQGYFAGAREGHGYVDYDSDKEPMRPFFTRALAAVESLLGRAGEVLDVGAATGFFLQLARERGWQVHGIEISSFAADCARKKGIDMFTGTLLEFPVQAESVTLVTLWDVIEHVQDPLEEMRRVHALLRPGGVVVLTTPNLTSAYARLMGTRWHALVPPEHLHYFTPTSMKKLLSDAGFEVVSLKAPVKSFTFAYIFQMLARWQKLRAWSIAADFFRRHKNLGNASIPLPLRDNLYVIARKQ